VDEFFTVRKGEMTIITGIPGHGKTEFIDALIINMIVLHRWKFGVFAAESLPHERHLAGYLEKYKDAPFGKSLPNRMTMDDVKTGCEWLDDYITFLNPSEDEFTLDRIIKLASVLHEKRGLDCLFIDPWNEMDHQRPAAMTETEYISQSLTKLRRFARRRKIHVFLVAHPTKLTRKNPNEDKYEIPTPYSISGSAAWRNKADNCLTVWRDYRKSGKTAVYVQKVRFKEIGNIGAVELDYDVITGRYHSGLKSFNID
jgi:twinkle protein